MSLRSRLVIWTAGTLAVLALTAACTTGEPTPKGTTTVTGSPTTTGTVSTSATATASTGATGVSGATGETAVIVPPSPNGTRYAYACAGGKKFEILAYPAAQERVTLFIEGKTVELKQERSGSGTRHSDGNYLLIAKGVDATIEQAGKTTYADCKATRL